MNEPVPTSVADEIRRLELRLHDPDVRADAGAVEALLCEDFVEFGMSGRRYDRASVLALLAAEASDGRRFETSAFEFARIGEDAVLVTYRATDAVPNSTPRHAWRSSLWLRVDGRWRMRFHQGTPTAAR